MRTIFDTATRKELIQRIAALDERSTAQWGTMTIYQMVKHNTLWTEMILGRFFCKRVFLGRLFGRIALHSSLKNEKPMGHNAPTSPELRVKDSYGDVALEKKKWIALLEEFEHFSNTDFVHPFFGAMTKEQIGYHTYKHIDHHLRQFNG